MFFNFRLPAEGDLPHQLTQVVSNMQLQTRPADCLQGWSPATRPQGPVFSSTPVRPSSTLITPAALLAAPDPVEDSRHRAWQKDIRQRRQGSASNLEASLSLERGENLFELKQPCQDIFSEDDGSQRPRYLETASRLLFDSIIELAEDSRVGEPESLLHCSHSLEVEVAEDQQQLQSRQLFPGSLPNPVGVWQRELRERAEPECLTYLQSRPVRPKLAGPVTGSRPAGGTSQQDWIRTVQESGRRVQSTIKAFKRYLFSFHLCASHRATTETLQAYTTNDQATLI